MTKQYRAVGLFSNRQETEAALRELIKKHGFPSDRISVIARDKERGVLKLNSELYQTVESANQTPTGVASGGLTGGTLGGITGLLIGLGTIAIPGVGPIMLAGAAATAIATTIAGSAIGAATGTLAGGLVGLGLDQDSAKAYRTKVVDGGYLVIIEGTIDEIQLAEEILTFGGMEDWEVLDAFEQEATKAAEVEQSEPLEELGQLEQLEQLELIEIEKPILSHHLRMMGTFPHLPEAKTALIDLMETGYPLDRITLFISDDDRHDWFPNLKVYDALDYSFNRLPEDRRAFYQECFSHGQYILMIDGTDLEIQDAELELRNEGFHGFYIFDPYENSDRITDDISLDNSRQLVEIVDNRDR